MNSRNSKWNILWTRKGLKRVVREWNQVGWSNFFFWSLPSLFCSIMDKFFQTRRRKRNQYLYWFLFLRLVFVQPLFFQIVSRGQWPCIGKLEASYAQFAMFFEPGKALNLNYSILFQPALAGIHIHTRPFLSASTKFWIVAATTYLLIKNRSVDY